MHPAFSVIFLTTLIGVGQGLFLALYTGEIYSTLDLLPAQGGQFYVIGSVIAVVFMAAGLLASFFHLGHPERAWRSAARWRTSWLSREVIVLPAVISATVIYGGLHYFGWGMTADVYAVKGLLSPTILVGAAGTVAAFALFLCTGMIYACIKFLQEWASSLTVINYTLFGLASGFALATAYAAYSGSELVSFYGVIAIVTTVVAFITRVASLFRNARIKHKSTLQSALGVRHNRIQQRSQGFMGGSFNTREFFHGASVVWFKSIKWVFLVLVFPVPIALLVAGINAASFDLLAAAFVVQYIGLIAERWFFFAQANHPQNLYYQTVG